MAKTRVRVAVIMNEHGRWNAIGWSKKDGKPVSDDAASGVCRDGLDEVAFEKLYFIEAELDVPVPETVQAVVS